MKKYKVAYIDDDPDSIIRFQSRVYETLDVVVFSPKTDLDHFVEELLRSDAEAFVVDFRLNVYREDEKAIAYTGADLVEKILQVRRDFPCFILTGYDSDAVLAMDDVNYVYSKDILVQQSGEITFAEKIRVQISHYQTKIQQSNSRFQELLIKSDSQNLAENEEQELLHLDSFLESALGDHMALPAEKKSKLAAGKLDELIASTRNLINVLKKGKD